MVPCKVVKAEIISYVLLGKALAAYFVCWGGRESWKGLLCFRRREGQGMRKPGQRNPVERM